MTSDQTEQPPFSDTTKDENKILRSFRVIIDSVSFKRQFKITSCERGDTICPRSLYAGRCGPDAAAQLQPIPYTCGAQRALLPIAVGAVNVNELMNYYYYYYYYYKCTD